MEGHPLVFFFGLFGKKEIGGHLMMWSSRTNQSNLILCPYFWVGLGRTYKEDKDHYLATFDFVEWLSSK